MSIIKLIISEFEEYIYLYLVGLIILIGCGLIYFIWTENKISLKYMNHSTTTELIWTILPAVVLLLISIPSFKIIEFECETVDPSLTLKIIGNQWFWSYEIGDTEFDSYTIGRDKVQVDNEVTLPTRNIIRLLVTANDVIHSWFIPELGIKMDGVPTRINSTWTYILGEGKYWGFCTELCGHGHSNMNIIVNAVPMSEYYGSLSPLEMFKVVELAGINNSSIFIIATVTCIFGLWFMFFDTNIKGNNTSNFLIALYDGFGDTIKGILGQNGSQWYPFLMSLFIFIWFNNLLGLLPYSFANMAHIIITGTTSLSIVIGLTFLGLHTLGSKFIYIFIPSGIPSAIVPLMFLIEIISYLSRIVSLSVRLSANIAGGHLLLNILASFAAGLFKISPILVLLPLVSVSVIFCLEFAVSFIQAFVFTVLTTTYFSQIYIAH